MDNKMTGLIVEKVSKSFGTNQVIKDYDLSVNKGDITIVLGESGSGKTTLLRMINNLEEVDSGSISINGNYLVKDGVYQSNQDLQKYQYEIGLVFQDYQLFPNLTVMENLLLAPLSNNFGSKEELTKQARNLLTDMKIIDKADLKPHQLSGGQQQRVAIARAMMMNPSLLCFDEPTSALDEKTVKRVAEIIQGLADKGIMILIITHDPILVDLIGERARVLDASEFK